VKSRKLKFKNNQYKNMKHYFSLLLTTILFFILPITSPAVDIEEIVRSAVEPFVGCTVGIVFGDDVKTFGFGHCTVDSDTVPDGESVFEIGSITKVFTGVLLAEMILQNEVSPDDSLSALLPVGTVLPEYGSKKITLRDLATHRSGLPRLSSKMWDTANKTPTDPYSLFTREMLFQSLSDWKPASAPDERHEYSNFGFALLGNVIANRVGIPYEKLLQQRILEPLGMRDTMTNLNESMKLRLVPGHDAGKKRCDNWNLAAYNPAGGLRSTANDMNRFALAALGRFDLLKNENLSAEQQSRLEKAFELAMKPIAEANAPNKVGSVGFTSQQTIFRGTTVKPAVTFLY
jgi:CubicO group peptidase (beta-lactamase class C family)